VNSNPSQETTTSSSNQLPQSDNPSLSPVPTSLNTDLSIMKEEEEEQEVLEDGRTEVDEQEMKENEMKQEEDEKKKQHEKEDEDEESLVPFQTILTDPYLCSIFKKYLESCFQPAALLFWLDVEEFKRIPRSNFLQNRFRKIVHKYLNEGCSMPIPVSHYTCQTILQREDNPNPTIFRWAQEEVYRYMKSELFPKFKTSNQYEYQVVGYIECDKLAKEMEKNPSCPKCFPSSSSSSNLPLIIKSKDIPLKCICETSSSSSSPFSNITSTSYSGTDTRRISEVVGRRSSLSDDPSLLRKPVSNISDLLKLQLGVCHFKEFCVQRFLFQLIVHSFSNSDCFIDFSHCSENILFWLEADDFKNIPGKDYQFRTAKKIVAKYISGFITFFCLSLIFD